jgi:hypothetical protein
MKDVTVSMEPDYAKLLKRALENPEPKPGKDKPPLLQGAKRKFEMKPGSAHFKFLGTDKGSFEFLDTDKGLLADRGKKVHS